MSGTDSTPNPTPANLPPPGIELKDATVRLDGLDAVLVQFLRSFGLVHMHLFGTVAIITSARDSVHVPGSKHGQGKALDFRISDKDGRSQFAMLAVLIQLSARYRLAVFDESYLPAGAHIHVEVAG